LYNINSFCDITVTNKFFTRERSY